MKILVISNLYPPHHIGGYELRCAAVVNALRGRGHDVHVLTSNHHCGLAADEPQVTRSLRVHGFYGHPWLPIMKLSALERHNNDELRRVIAEVQPDLVHVWNLGGISKSLIFTLERLGLPTAYDISDHWIARSLKADVWLDWWNRPIGDMSLTARTLRTTWEVSGQRQRLDRVAPTQPAKEARFRRVYFCSAALRRITQEKGYDVGHGHVIHCPVDTERFTGEPAPATAPVTKLLYVGRLAEDKGVMTALRAMALLKGSPACELHIYGQGDADYTALLYAFVAEHQLPVTFNHGTPEQMPAIYRAHDALLFTSEWEEPFALTPLEAMASGLPVIGTTTGGSAELLRHGVNALTYTAGQGDELATCIRQLCHAGDLRHRLAVAGQREVRARCAEPLIIDQIEAFLTETFKQWRCQPVIAEAEIETTTATLEDLAA